MATYFKSRYTDKSEYYPISDRIDLTTYVNVSGVDVWNYDCYRGDCYICEFTHRLNRNFQDASNPVNDVIVDKDTWSKNYKYTGTNENINRGDVNAVQLG
jgi:hypothetical protein